MLCNAIAIANLIPIVGLDVYEINVAIPSGMLCIMIVKSESIPKLYKVDLFLSFEFLFIILKINIPSENKNNVTNIAWFLLNVWVNNLNDSGISENIDKVIITPDENIKDEEIILSLLFFNKQGIIPREVDKPANRVVIKQFINLFIVLYMIIIV